MREAGELPVQSRMWGRRPVGGRRRKTGMLDFDGYRFCIGAHRRDGIWERKPVQKVEIGSEVANPADDMRVPLPEKVAELPR